MNRKYTYDEDKEMLNAIRSLNEQRAIKRQMLNEEVEGNDKSDAIPITNDPRFGENVLQHQIDSFRQIVNPGAKFGDENNEDAESNPLVFYPKDGNLVFSGSIPSMSGLRFQYSLNDVTGAPYIFNDGLALTDDVFETLKRMKGHFTNWKKEWQTEGDMLEKLGKGED